MTMRNSKKFWLITTDHLEEGLWFRDEKDFAVGMNHVAIQAALTPEVIVVAFILMSNHVHFVLYGTEDDVRAFVNAFKSRYSQYLFRKYGINEQLRRNGVQVKEIPADKKDALKRAIAYVQMNCVAARICSHPSQYPWGTGNVFFNVTGVMGGRPVASLSHRARERMFHSEFTDLPGKWQVSETGYVLPQSYVAVGWVEELFQTPGRMNYFLNTSSKARRRMEQGEDALPSFKDQVILKALPDLCQSLFQEPDFKRLKDSDQTEVLRQVRYRFSANVNQVARVCGISYAEAARMLDGE